MDDQGSVGGAEIFLLATASRPALGPIQPPIQSVPRFFCQVEKRPGREDDHSPPSAEDKNAWSLLPLLHTSTWCAAKTLPKPLIGRS
jgi:hypothetical protein